ncbi:MAG: cytochrome [Nocardioides sp.]|nr:cytochrome [Nocardioides sp.]
MHLLDPEINADPYPYLNQLRDRSPIAWSEVHRAWLVTGYDEIKACLKIPSVSADRVSLTSADAAKRERASQILSSWMVFNNPPDHRRLRDAFREAFSPRTIDSLADTVQGITIGHTRRTSHSGGVGDLVSDVAHPVPAAVFSHWLGVPPRDQPAFWFWNARVADLILGNAQSADEYTTSIESLIHLHAYMSQLVEQAMNEPGDDLIGSVVARGHIGRSVTPDEFVSMLTQLAFAGGETTSNLIANAVRALLRDGSLWASLRDDPHLVSSAVDETMRFDGPSKMSVRVAARDFDFRRCKVREGSRILLVTAAANRDPRRFHDPDRFDPRRDASAHLGFGYGAHFCIGASLARLVANTAIRSLVEAFPDLELLGSDHEWHLSLLNRTLRSLPVQYGATVPTDHRE